MDGDNETALTVRADYTALRNKTAKVTAIRQAEATILKKGGEAW